MALREGTGRVVQGVPRVVPQSHHHGGKAKLEGDRLRLLKILVRTIKFLASLLDELVRERNGEMENPRADGQEYR
jgi:hypothetical protein